MAESRDADAFVEAAREGDDLLEFGDGGGLEEVFRAGEKGLRPGVV